MGDKSLGGGLPYSLGAALYLAIFEQGGSANIFSVITGGAEMALLRAL